MLKKSSNSTISHKLLIFMPRPVNSGSYACNCKKVVFLLLIVVVACSLILYHSFLHSRFELPEPLHELRRLFGDGDVKSRRRPDMNKHASPDAHLQTIHKRFPVIHISVVVCGKKLDEALVNLKIVSVLSRHFLHLHLFAQVELHEAIEKTIMKWPAWRGLWLQFEIHPIKYPVTLRQEKWINLFKLCASQRLFLAQLLPDLDSLIYLDTDVMLVEPPENLWSHFSLFNESQLAGLSYENYNSNGWYNSLAQHPFYEPYGINSGVMLMNLTRIRSFNWEEKILEIRHKYDKNIPWGDQDILNIFFHTYRHFLYILSCNWNYRPDLCMYGSTCNDIQSSGLNALHGSRDAFHDKKHAEFKLMFDIAKLYTFGTSYRAFVLAHIQEALRHMKSKPISSYCHILLDILEDQYKKS